MTEPMLGTLIHLPSSALFDFPLNHDPGGLVAIKPRQILDSDCRYATRRSNDLYSAGTEG